MVIDTSAIIAILFNEDDAKIYFNAIELAGVRMMAAPTCFETSTVVGSRLGHIGLSNQDALLRVLDINIISFSPSQYLLAREAFMTFGKGQGHPAQLNYGDCMSYALAKMEGMPLLFKGDDFKLTDVECAV